MNEKKEISQEELRAINRYTRRDFAAKDLYAFSVVLCDNEIDRDYERFSDNALEKLAELYVGVTGITDHSPKSSHQGARIFACHTETVEGRMTTDGRPYRRLCARAYLPRSEQNREVILALDSGIRKEVSVGCAVRKRICSVCGGDMGLCGHSKGREYDGQLCYATLDEPTDAYEWSFVAIPAQKGAGVIKGFEAENKLTKSVRCLSPANKRRDSSMEIEKKLASQGEQQFSAEEMQALARKFKELQQQAFDGAYYRSRLEKEVKGLSAVVFPELKSETLEQMTASLSLKGLDELKAAFESKASEILPLKPQLSRTDAPRAAQNNTIYQNI